jgi:hypothetical protein
MRLEYTFELSSCEVPRFSVEAEEGIGKLFTLTTLILNVLETRTRVELVFYGLNPEDPGRKIDAFKEILGSCGSARGVVYELGNGGRVPGSSITFQWIVLRRDPI